MTRWLAQPASPCHWTHYAQPDEGVCVWTDHCAAVVHRGVGVQTVVAARGSLPAPAGCVCRFDSGAQRHPRRTGPVAAGAVLLGQTIWAVAGVGAAEPVPVLPDSLQSLRSAAGAGGAAAELYLGADVGLSVRAAVGAAPRRPGSHGGTGQLQRRDGHFTPR